MSTIISLVGKRFGKLVVLARAHTSAGRKVHWKCQCDCGNVCVVAGTHLNSGQTKSCKCIMRNARRKDEPQIVTAKRIYAQVYSDGDLLFDDFYRLSQMNCNYCGIEPSNTGHAYKPEPWRGRYDEYFWKYNGLDRVDSSKPHNLDNLVTCCAHCNFAKMDFTVEEFTDWLKRAYKHYIKNN